MQKNIDVHDSSKFLDIQRLFKELSAIRADMISEEARGAARLAKVHPSHQASARNLLHYLALRRRDLHPLQLSLAELGLSSFGRAESHVLAALDAALIALHRLTKSTGLPLGNVTEIKFSQSWLNHNESRLGSVGSERRVRVMAPYTWRSR